MPLPREVGAPGHRAVGGQAGLGGVGAEVHVGAALGVGGHLTALRRTAVGPFDLAVAHTLEELGEDFRLLPIADAARSSFTALDLDETMAQDVCFGRKLELELGGTTAVFAPDGEFLALYEPTDQPGLARATAVFTG